ncbi:LysM peptidoglycan-binding domain-containing protein [Evansella sp. AB-P1]|uniref:LysM peptidoglycan-binding domain-containing protein n=1 Tax=Evansella sp. AB-P1 TaxID=3037653 RepID=UPI00241CFB4B|nr:LysM peptidoglycan-binding domain-containing protein [Evansella sp. AB-P1]MDG5790075.1 LysM peptidoglycan-binding domain-containing protein [Evansella sp. AB-P1]
MIQKYELKTVGNETVLVVYLDQHMTEFSTELGQRPKEKEELSKYIRTQIKRKFPKLKVHVIKVMSGSLLVSSIYLSGGTNTTYASNNDNKTSINVNHGQQFDTYTVRSGDSLSVIARDHDVSVSSIKEINNLKTNMIFVGQVLLLPYLTYTVLSGDSLFNIARNYNISVNELKSYNNISSDTIFIGQKLRIPRSTEHKVTAIENDPLPNTEENQGATEKVETSTTYTVVAGDSLSVIARRFDTTVADIKTLNGLSSDVIRVGQVLHIPQKTASVPTEEEVSDTNPTPGDKIDDTTQSPDTDHANSPVEEAFATYTVVAGDSLSVIAKRYDTTVADIKAINGLSSDRIFIGQALQIPTKEDNLLDPVEETKIPEEDIEINTGEEPPPTQDSTFLYTVVAGDSLSVIAKRYDTTVADIKELNSLSSDRILIGQVLHIPNKVDDPIDPEPIPPSIPELTLLGPINYENSSHFPIVGESSPNATILLTITDGVNETLNIETATNDEGRFESTVDFRPLQDGEIQISVVAKNKHGQESDPLRLTVEKDTEIDVPVIDTKTEFVNLENQESYRIYGTGKRNATIFITVTDDEGNEVIEEVTTDDEGAFVVTMNLRSLVDSDLMIRVKQRDTVGNTSPSQLLFVEKDATAPEVPILDIDEGAFVNNQNEENYTFEGTTEASSTVSIQIVSDTGQQLNETAIADKTGRFHFSMNLSEFDNGPITISIKQQDKAGNESEALHRTIMKNTIEPDLTLPPFTAIFSGNVYDYVVRGHTAVNSEVHLSITDGDIIVSETITSDENGDFSLTLDLRLLQDGDLKASFYTIDPYGNIGEEQEFNILKDTIAPYTLVLDDIGFVNNTNQSNYTIRGTNEEDGVLITVLLTDNVHTLTETVEVVDGKFRFDLDLSEFVDGPINVAITQTDTVGNVSESNMIVIEKDTDISDPIISKSGFAFEGDKIVYNVSGIGEPLSTISITIDDQAGGEPITIEHQVGDRGVFTIDVNISDLDLTRGLLVSVTKSDAAGNISDVVTPDFLTYTVVSGDTLSHIALRNHTTVEAIRRMNNLSSDMIYVDQKLKLPITAGDTLNLGYIYFGDPKNFTNQVLATERSFNNVSPSYFDVNPDGTLKVTAQFDPIFIQNMHNQGIRVTPFLSNHWDQELGRAMLANREQAAQQIADVVIRYDLGGVNVDLENINHQDRDNFTEFVRLLREKIPSSKEVSVAVAANPNGWTQGWHGAYDYAALAKYADYLMIMSYDESYPGSAPGPVASLPWVERSIQYAIAQGVPKDKVVIGLAHYGRYWSEDGNIRGNGISNFQIQEMLSKYEHTITYDEKSQSVKAVVTVRENDPKMYMMGRVLAPGSYTVWYENDQSYAAKVDLVQKYGIRGVGHWSIGQENRDIWNSYHTWFTPRDNATIPGEISPIVEPIQEESVGYFNYTVQSGDSLYRIALRNNTNIDVIKDANNLTGDMIFIGQVLKIPTT